MDFVKNLARAAVTLVPLVVGCRWHFAADEHVDAIGEIDVVDTTSPCAYQCSIDATTGTSTCAAPVTTTAGPTTDELVAVLDMSGYAELSLAAMICDPILWTLHIGDSPSNNGFGGDGGQFSNDAELQLVDQTLTVFGNQPSNSMVLQMVPGILAATGCTMLTGTLRDQQVMFSANATVDVTSPFSLRLNPPSDSEGVPDALWYLGVNRTYQASGRTGTGLQRLDLCLR